MNKNLIVNGIVAGVVAIGTAVAAYKIHKLTQQVKAITGTVDKAVDDLAKDINTHVTDAIVNSAVEKAVDREASRAIYNATSDVVSEMKKDMRLQIREHIDGYCVDLKSMVKEEMNRQVKKISVEEIRQEVIADAKDEAAKRFKADLDKILEQHNEELNKVTEIYSSIAKSMRGDNK